MMAIDHESGQARQRLMNLDESNLGKTEKMGYVLTS